MVLFGLTDAVVNVLKEQNSAVLEKVEDVLTKFSLLG
jgi:hypothetical protein